jgi:hypothetical protein
LKDRRQGERRVFSENGVRADAAFQIQIALRAEADARTSAQHDDPQGQDPIKKSEQTGIEWRDHPHRPSLFEQDTR